MEKTIPTKTKLLNAAQALMLKTGFTATSVDEICEKAGVTKGSFFHYFESKEDLGAAALDHFWGSQHDVLEHAPFNRLADPLDRLYAYVDFFIAAARNPRAPKSCLFGNFSQELSDTHAGIRERCAEGFSSWAGEVEDMIDAAKKVYAPNKKFEAKEVAQYFLALFEGSLILAKAHQNSAVIEKNMKLFKSYLENLFGKGQH